MVTINHEDINKTENLYFITKVGAFNLGDLIEFCNTEKIDLYKVHVGDINGKMTIVTWPHND